MSEQFQPLVDPSETGDSQPPTDYTAEVAVSNESPNESPLRLPSAVLVGEPESAEPDSKPQSRIERLREEAYKGWLERRGIDPEDPESVPRLTMGEREFELFRNAPPDYLGYIRELYGIPQEDQANCQYALVDIQPAGPDQPPESELVIVNDADFGTTIDAERIAEDFQGSAPNPDDPTTPESPNDAYIIADIGDNLVDAHREVTSFARELMKGQTVDPFRDSLTNPIGDLGIRAGDIFPGQKDAYVWTTSPVTHAVELTLNLPQTYRSVCVVSGHRREAANGKAGMAQIENPRVVFKIEGEHLKRLQDTYRHLYREPGFKLTEQQRNERDTTFNAHVIHEISRAAQENQAQEGYEQHLRTQQPQIQARPLSR